MASVLLLWPTSSKLTSSEDIETANKISSNQMTAIYASGSEEYVLKRLIWPLFANLNHYLSKMHNLFLIYLDLC